MRTKKGEKSTAVKKLRFKPPEPSTGEERNVASRKKSLLLFHILFLVTLASFFIRETDAKSIEYRREDEIEGKFTKKSYAVLCIFAFGLAIGLVINFVNLHTDFQDLKDFYLGYQGRRMLISEGKLTSREYLEALKSLQESKEDNVSVGVHLLQGTKYLVNGFAPQGNTSTLMAELTLFQEQRKKLHPHCHSNFVAFTKIRPFVLSGEEPVGQPNHAQWIQHHLPLYASHFIEDQDPEWRDLDYSIEVGEPPDDLCQFIRHYDWRLFYFDKSMTEEALLLRRNLLYQFRKWKKRRRKLWRIVVTERAKKEMAEQDTMGGGGVRR